MGKLAVSKPEHNGTLWYSYLTDGGTTWSSPVEVTETFLSDRTKTYVGQVSDRFNFSGVFVEAERFIMYYPAVTTLDKIYLSGLSQSTNLTFDVYADNVTEGVIPTTKILGPVSQTVPARPRNTSNQLLSFTEQAATCFMVEVTDIGSRMLDGQGYELLVNGDFETGDDTGWTVVGDIGTGVFASSPGFGNGDYYANMNTFGGGASFSQVVDFTGAGDLSLSVSVNVFGPTNNGSLITVVGNATYVSASIDAVSSYEEIFVLPSGNTNVTVTVTCPSSTTPVDDISLVVVAGEFNIPDPLDHRAIFFGKQIYQPEYNYNYGGALDNSRKYQSDRTQTSNYQFKTNSTRSDQLTIDHESNEAIKDLEYLDYELQDGYCFYQRDVDATDPAEYFLANFQHGARQNDFRDYNSTNLSFEETHEWR